MPFSLVRDAWLPVIDGDGERRWVRPAEVVDQRGGKPWLAFDTGRAELDMACLEFVAGLLAVACPPDGPEAFEAWYEEPPAVGELDGLFERYESAFRLGGDGPQFMQDPIPSQLSDAVPIHRLLLASWANENFFSAGSLTGGVDRPVRFGPAGVALALFAHQITATSGGRGYRTSPRGGGPLTTVLVPYVGGGAGHDAPAPLWQRIWLNVPDGGESFERPLDHYFPWLLRGDEVNFGRAVAPGPGVAREQVMFPMPRRVVVEWTTVEGGVRCDLTGLVSDVVATSFRRIHNGLEYPSEAWAHPYTPRYRSKAGSNVTLPVRPRPGHDTLGDWVGLTLMRADRSTEPAPIVVEWMRRRSDVVPSVRLHALGFSTDNAKITDFMDRTVPVIHADDPDVDRVVSRAAGDMASACHEMGGALKEAVRGSTFREKDGAAGKSLLVAALPGMLSKRVSGRFFEALGRILADAQAEDEVREDWFRVIGDAAETMLDELRPLEEAGPDRLAGWLAQRRFLRAAVKGTSQTGRKIRNVLGLPQAQKAKDAEVPGAGELEDANP